ncbi:hypothetical protein [Streptomyces sp. BA2]|uniref:hypothetical protein n=1 Tax=Streptomyces sp. BA2 TaxID=436595 RepID=UPI001328AF5A|nr:hypothetical protein [Streptomyces sp. BA2]MWA12805.1 hypothetical protein [Streptomyces sp. BA2]
MKSLKRRGITATTALTAAVFVVGAFGATSASASAPSTTATKAAAISCAGGNYVKAHESVKIRKSMKVNSTALGLLPKGKKAKLLKCQVDLAGTYSLCGWKDDNRWHHVNYRGIKGYVPLACVV